MHTHILEIRGRCILQYKLPFSQLLQIWKLFIILKQPVHISGTVFYNLTKLTNYLFIFTFKFVIHYLGLVVLNFTVCTNDHT